ncbi:MAG: hypothetical protein EAY79_03950 [Runella slithyformis]|nr:MAG: hypothetical protein EAY79_03950 [Runella slithyformis]TAF01250.1 MAG: hypothetical protein EAZ80_02875 [Runella slithyformis]TAF47779.1 MAG: hypothetical protein EAZ63_06730 [Runella slithyformis]
METYKKIRLETDELLFSFDLKRNRSCEILDSWLNVSGLITKEHQDFLEKLRQLQLEEGDFWNEEELKMNFLAHIFYVAQLNEKDKIKLFYERPLAGIIGEYKINVKCDALIATPKGIGTPRKPYFFLQEFKKQKGQENDAEGQMLAAMLLAQLENDNNLPIYGSYLQGSTWRFTTLHGKNYCVSQSYDANQKEDLEKLILILRKLKVLILSQIEQ